jgi:ABC-2 type transport system permease protein
VSGLLRAEFLKLRTTRTTLELLLTMTGLIVAIILLHELELPVANLGSETRQLGVLGQGERMGILFAALLGVMAITSEFRHGTIRPTLMVTPRRGRVVAAKVAVSLAVGLVFGVIAMGIAIGVGTGALLERGVTIRLVGSDYSQLLLGGAVGAALWSVIGMGVGALVRNQVPVVVGITAWLLFLEGLLFGDLNLSDWGRFLPGALAQGAIGLEPTKLLSPGPAVLLLVLYALAATVVGSLATTRRDVP